MRVLLDSHFAFWLYTHHVRVDETVRRRLSRASAIHVSAATVWELAIKRAVGKLDVDLEGLLRHCEVQGFVALPVTMRHGLIAGQLPLHHNDPFDRMLVAQAISEQLQLVTADAKLRDYASLVALF